jgi:hypothetical protein
MQHQWRNMATAAAWWADSESLPSSAVGLLHAQPASCMSLLRRSQRVTYMGSKASYLDVDSVGFAVELLKPST